MLAASPSLQRPTVLIVDDDGASSALCADIFSRAGYLVIVAHDGAHALRLALERRPDVILTDLYLPELDGCQMLDLVRRAGLHVPVVIMSGSVDGKIRAFRAGADGFLEKPFDVCDAVAEVRRVVAARSRASGS